jgi:hypothetical protein
MMAALAVVALCGSGCASLEKRFGEPLPLERFAEVETGCHYSTILQRFGPPMRMTALPSGMAFQYEYVRIDERQFGITLPGAIGKWLKAVFASADAKVETMLFIFDDEGVLLGADPETYTADAGAGFSMTLIFSIGSLTDTSDYEASADSAMTWGLGLTDPLLVSLNREQNLDTGANGLQLSGTPDAVGQHTLESGARQ